MSYSAQFRGGASFGMVRASAATLSAAASLLQVSAIFISYCFQPQDVVALELERRGVPKQDIVLAFQSPFKRQFTEYAVG